MTFSRGKEEVCIFFLIFLSFFRIIKLNCHSKLVICLFLSFLSCNILMFLTVMFAGGQKREESARYDFF